MSVFDKIIAEHHASIETENEKEELEAKKKVDERGKFQEQFLSAIEEVALPLFEQLSSDLAKHGYAASIENARDGLANPYLSIKFLADGGEVSTEQDYSVFVLKGNLGKLKVEHNSYHDQRRGANGITKREFGVQSINNNVLERHLADFVSASLKSRKDV